MSKHKSEDPPLLENRSDGTTSNEQPLTVTLGGLETRTGPEGAAQPTPRLRMPESIGEYRIIGLLGEGGMGVVWEAEQKHPRRRVAVKVMRQGHRIDAVQARMFEREAETLGRLRHPNIAAIYESGHTEDGNGFFAMELVLGQALGRWIGGRPSPVTPEELALRLKMFQVVCGAVNYAHQRGVIHRDLKPSNIAILDGPTGGSGSPGEMIPAVKVLDFGLARITDRDVDGPSQMTEMGVIRGTLQYMSPEQACGKADTIDVRTDVYALGMILYELVTGKLAYDLGDSPLVESVKTICEVAPQPLREAWRGTRRLNPDVETIVGKALEKDPDRRYPSAAALSEDIERYLTSQPIAARPPSRVYRSRMFLRRHRISASVAAALVLLLMAFAGSMAIQADRIARERDRANREAEASNRVADFMVGMFKVSDPGEARGNSITAREILDKASKEIDRGLAKDRQVQARLMQTMGKVYQGLGLYSTAEPLLERSMAADQSLLGSENPETSRSMRDLAIVWRLQGRYGEAEKMDRQVLELQHRLLGPSHLDTLSTMSELAIVLWYQGHLAEAEKVCNEAIEGRSRLLGPEHVDTLKTMNTLALIYSDEGRYADAEKLYRNVLDVGRRVLGPDHPDTMKWMNNLAKSYDEQGRFPEAEKLHLEALELRRRVLGPDHPDTLQAMSNLASVYYDERRLPEAEKIYRETLDTRARVLGPNHPDTLLSMGGLANVYDMEGHHAEAEKLYREMLDIRRRLLGPEHPDTLGTMNDLALVYTNEARYSQAELLFREVLDVRRRTLGPNSPGIAVTLYCLGGVAALRGDRGLALSYVRQALDHGLPPRVALDLEGDFFFKSLHGDARFEALVAESKKHAGTAP